MMPDHYEPPRGWRGLAMTVAWVAAACLTLAGRALSRPLGWWWRVNVKYWTGEGVRWRTVAFVGSAVLVGAVLAWRGGVTVGPGRVEAAGEPRSSGTAAQDIVVDEPRYTGADVMATAAAVVALNAQPSAVHDDPMAPLAPEAAGPGGPVLPEADAPDDGSPPAWLSRELSPYWGVIAAAAHERGIDSHWMGILAMVENPQAVTDIVTFDGGHGLAQIQSGTAAAIQAESGLPCVDGWMDPTTSYRCGAFYFRQAIDDGADLVRPGDNEPALLMGVAGYNSGRGSPIVKRMREALASGDADPCAWIANEYTRRYCYSARDMWGQTLAMRGVAAPAAAEPGPFAAPRVAPGAPSHLEVSSVQP